MEEKVYKVELTGGEIDELDNILRNVLVEYGALQKKATDKKVINAIDEYMNKIIALQKKING